MEDSKTIFEFIIKEIQNIDNEKDKKVLMDIIKYLKKDIKDLYSLTYALSKKELLKNESFFELLNSVIEKYALLVSLIRKKESVVFFTYPKSKWWYCFGCVSNDLKEKILKVIE